MNQPIASTGKPGQPHATKKTIAAFHTVSGLYLIENYSYIRNST
jgi:hypothetical protein